MRHLPHVPVSVPVLVLSLVASLGAASASASERPSPTETGSPTPSGVGTVVEHASFELVEDADVPAFVDAARAVTRDFLERREGFVRRSLSRGEDGRWVDHLEWTTLEAALGAAEAIMADPAAARFLAAIDLDSLELRHLVLEHARH